RGLPPPSPLGFRLAAHPCHGATPRRARLCRAWGRRSLIYGLAVAPSRDWEGGTTRPAHGGGCRPLRHSASPRSAPLPRRDSAPGAALPRWGGLGGPPADRFASPRPSRRGVAPEGGCAATQVEWRKREAPPCQGHVLCPLLTRRSRDRRMAAPGEAEGGVRGSVDADPRTADQGRGLDRREHRQPRGAVAHVDAVVTTRQPETLAEVPGTAQQALHG